MLSDGGARGAAGTAIRRALIALYLDMLAAERGAGVTRSTPIGATLRISPLTCTSQAVRSPRAGTEDLRAYLGGLARRGMRASTVARRLSAIRQLYRFLYAEGRAQGRSGRGARRPEARPHVAEELQHRRSRSAARARRRHAIRRRRCASGCVPRGSACLVETALRHRPAGVGTGGAAGFGRAPRRARHHRARQGQQGAHGAAQRGRQARDGGPTSRCSAKRSVAPNRNGCFRHSARAAI